jgi:hypothetical protein
VNSKGMKKEEKSSIPVSHATRERVNNLKYVSQAQHKREFNQDDIIRFLLDFYETHGNSEATCAVMDKVAEREKIRADSG